MNRGEEESDPPPRQQAARNGQNMKNRQRTMRDFMSPNV